MKNIALATLCILTMSCKNSNDKNKDFESLLVKISLLEEQNKKLKDSLTKNEGEFLYSQILLGIPDNQIQKVGKKNNIVMLFQSFDRKLPKYEIYRIIGEKEIKIGENDQTRFNFEFTPKSVKDNSPEFLIKMPYNGRTISIPGKLILDVEK